mmetsp:Transcript_41887/g.107189  ORF Transcript_41887/g.107189 Transcript_41887/m.107189 type:complete len:134 (+) Transcript_41887:972-1373(+)
MASVQDALQQQLRGQEDQSDSSSDDEASLEESDEEGDETAQLFRMNANFRDMVEQVDERFEDFDWEDAMPVDWRQHDMSDIESWLKEQVASGVVYSTDPHANISFSTLRDRQLQALTVVKEHLQRNPMHGRGM